MPIDLTAYCGINCARCPAYQLPRLGERLHLAGLCQRLLKNGMRRARRQMARKLGVAESAVPHPELDADTYIVCDGCTMIGARIPRHCLNCSVRCCAMEMGVKTCAHCTRFPCERLEVLWKTMVFKDARPRLERMKARLASSPGRTQT
jgi:hypothetical protein